MSSGFHYLGANAKKLEGWSNSYRLPQVLAHEKPATMEFDKKTDDFVTMEPPHFDVGPAPVAMARMQGYTGDACSICGSMKMKMAGHCMVCEDCGETTGCS